MSFYTLATWCKHYNSLCLTVVWKNIFSGALRKLKAGTATKIKFNP